MNSRPSLESRLQPVMTRLEHLINKAENPRATMLELEAMLQEEGIAQELQTEDVETFSLDLMQLLMTTDLDAYRIPLQPLREFETAEDLIAAMLVRSRQ